MLAEPTLHSTLNLDRNLIFTIRYLTLTLTLTLTLALTLTLILTLNPNLIRKTQLQSLTRFVERSVALPKRSLKR